MENEIDENNEKKHYNRCLVKVLDIKRDKNLHYFIDKDGSIFQTDRKSKGEKIADISNFHREKYFYYFITTNPDGFLVIEKAVRITRGMEQYKTLKFPRVEETGEGGFITPDLDNPDLENEEDNEDVIENPEKDIFSED